MEVIRLFGPTTELSDLRESMLSQKFADVALCCAGGQRFLAHRLVLSAASPYLQEVLISHSCCANGCEPVTLILAEVEATELAALLGLVYTGRASVARDRLDDFICVANLLRIKLPDFRSTINTSPGNDWAVPAEDLSYDRSSCWEWKLASSRRQVANQVTASPWSQTLRPYHLPKLQPIVLQQTYNAISPPLNASFALEPRVTEAALITTTTTPTVAAGNCYYCCEQSLSPMAITTTSISSPSLNKQQQQQQQQEQQFVHLQVPTSLENNQVGKHTAPNPMPKSNRPGARTELSLPVSRLCDSLTNEDALPSDQLRQPVIIRSPGASAGPTVTAANLVVPLTSVPAPINDDNNNYISNPVNDDDKNNNNNNNNNNDDDDDNNDNIKNNNNHRNGKSNEQSSSPASQGEQLDHKCEQCGKYFVTKASLKVHQRTHSGEKPFRCEDCGKQFSQLRNYKYHRSVHEGTREFAASCSECGKCFNDRGYLSSHMKIHRNRKEYGCNDCGKSFNQRVAYNMHVRIHTGLKPHQCEQCGKAFSRKMLLKQHLRTHSGERPYQCHVCHKAFADRSNMTLHTRLHSGLKPYKCTLCSKAFTKKHHLKTHLNYHTGTKPYSCPNCALSFSQSSNMRTHYKKCCLTQQQRKNPPKSLLTPPNSDQESSFLVPSS